MEDCDAKKEACRQIGVTTSGWKVATRDSHNDLYDTSVVHPTHFAPYPQGPVIASSSAATQNSASIVLESRLASRNFHSFAVRSSHTNGIRE